jgi:hypothetical protein
MSDSERITGIERTLRIFTALTSKSARFWLLLAVAALAWLLYSQAVYGRDVSAAKDAKIDNLEREFREHLVKGNAALISALERNTAAMEHSVAAWDRVRVVLERLPLSKN